MENSHLCPPSETIQSWVDGEVEDIGLQIHITDCKKCQALVSNLHRENEMLFQFLDQIPLMPDLSNKIMSRLKEHANPYHEMHSLFSYLLVTSLSLALVILHYIFTGLLSEEFWPVTLAKFLYLVSSLSHTVYATLKYFLARTAVGEPLLPALSVVITAILINIVYKRRISNA